MTDNTITELIAAAKNVLAQIDDLDRMAMPGAFERLEEAVLAIESKTAHAIDWPQT